MAPPGTICCHCGRHFRKPDEPCVHGVAKPPPFLFRSIAQHREAMRAMLITAIKERLDR